MTAFLVLGGEHEVIHDELGPAKEEILQGDRDGRISRGRRGRIEGVRLCHEDHGEIADLLGNLIGLLGVEFFLLEEGEAGLEPFLGSCYFLVWLIF